MSIGVTQGSGQKNSIRRVSGITDQKQLESNGNFNRLSTSIKVLDLDFTIAGWTRNSILNTTNAARATKAIKKENLVSRNGDGISIIHSTLQSGNIFTRTDSDMCLVITNKLAATGDDTSNRNDYKTDDAFNAEDVQSIIWYPNFKQERTLPKISGQAGTHPDIRYFSQFYGHSDTSTSSFVYNIKKQNVCYCKANKKDLFFYLFEIADSASVPGTENDYLVNGWSINLRLYYQDIFKD